MTDQNVSPEEKSNNKPAKPPIGKASVSSNGVSNGTATAVLVTPPPTEVVEPTYVDSAADKTSKGREALLQVDSYEEAESLLTENPNLIEQARVIFGSIVPTSGQNAFMELAIGASAEDDPMDLRTALQTKRERKLNLTTPEVDQILEFASENMIQSPALALNIALLLTDDLTRLEGAALWGKQKSIVLATQKALGVDAALLWEEISRQKVQQAPPAPQPKKEPVKVKAETKTPKKERPAPPPPPAKSPRKKKSNGPPRWLLATGFIGVMSVLSCGACAFGSIFW